MTSTHEADFERYKSGALIEELDKLTGQCGLGKLHGDETILGATRLTEQVGSPTTLQRRHGSGEHRHW